MIFIYCGVRRRGIFDLELLWWELRDEELRSLVIAGEDAKKGFTILGYYGGRCKIGIQL